jgi:phosphoribosylformylglycinamidine synthase
MKAKVYVTPKQGVLDPQGKAIHQAVKTIGYTAVSDIRQGKFFEIAIKDGLEEEVVKAEINSLAHSVLANPVIEDYKVVIEK